MIRRALWALLAAVLCASPALAQETTGAIVGTVVDSSKAALPGVTVNRNGGPASTTNVYLRGAEGRFTAVFIDGVRIDSQATGGVTWNAIPLSQVERIEVLRGPAAAVYGSDAENGGLGRLAGKLA